mgnify:FL=1
MTADPDGVDDGADDGETTEGDTEDDGTGNDRPDDDGTSGRRRLPPDEAFAVLGQETRLDILRILGDADDELEFAALFDRVDYDTSANFSYHLEQLVGHFVERTENGYGLRQAGRRVLEAILSGAVTDAPIVEPTEIAWPCQHCGASTVEVEYVEEQVGIYCTNCPGQYGGAKAAEDDALPADRARIGYVHLPPAGTRNRTAKEVLAAANTWTVMQAQSLHRGVCPRCSAAVVHDLDACGSHDASEGICDACDRRFAVGSRSTCTNCGFELGGSAIGRLHTKPDLLGFLFEHDVDPFASDSAGTLEVADFDETVLATDPPKVRFTFVIEDDHLELLADDDLDVVEATRRTTRDADS